MKRQFDRVDSSRGAPMGRFGSDESPTGRIRLFRVRLDSGGYDDGGAYWGHGAPLYCASNGRGYLRCIRANTRKEAAQLLGIEGNLKRACA